MGLAFLKVLPKVGLFNKETRTILNNFRVNMKPQKMR